MKHAKEGSKGQGSAADCHPELVGGGDASDKAQEVQGLCSAGRSKAGEHQPTEVSVRKDKPPEGRRACVMPSLSAEARQQSHPVGRQDLKKVAWTPDSHNCATSGRESAYEASAARWWPSLQPPAGGSGLACADTAD